MSKFKGPKSPFAGAPKLTKTFFMQTTKQLRSCYYSLRKYGIRHILIQDNYIEIYVGTKEAFYEIVQELPNAWTERRTSENIVYHKCQPVDSILILCEEELTS